VAEKLVALAGSPDVESSPQAATVVNRAARTTFGIAKSFIPHSLSRLVPSASISR